MVLHAMLMHGSALVMPKETNEDQAEPMKLKLEKLEESMFGEVPSDEILKTLVPGYKGSIDGSQDHHRRLIIWKKGKLAFLPISKNANTDFSVLFNRLNDVLNGKNLYFSSAPLRFGVKSEKMTKENGWKWAVFLRDPIDRFMSAWRSKCIQREDEGVHCPIGFKGGGRQNVSYQANRLNDMAEFYGTHALPKDGHWKTQSEQIKQIRLTRKKDEVGLFNSPSDFDFVGTLSGDVNEQVHQMLKMTGVKYKENIVDRWFPKLEKNKVIGHSSNKGHSNFNKTLLLTDTTKAALTKVFDQEYKELGLKNKFETEAQVDGGSAEGQDRQEEQEGQIRDKDEKDKTDKKSKKHKQKSRSGRKD